jgi:uncharacterized protein
VYFVLKLSKLCNLRCTYCYEYDELGRRERMPLQGLEYFFSHAADYLTRSSAGSVNFVLHGGEPALIPADYLREFVGLAHRHLAARGIDYHIAMQTNLFRLDEGWVDLLEEFGISLGVSLDVFGGERVTMGGQDSQQRVLRNLQRLIDLGGVDRLKLGGISVLHRGNHHAAVATYRFFSELRIGYRILPIFSMTDVPDRMRHLMLEHAEVLAALQDVAVLMLESREPIRVYPLWNYFEWAVNHVAGIRESRYDPRSHEWALIVNTNGEVYNHAEAYLPDGLLGNLYSDPLDVLMSKERRARSIALRTDRARACDRCEYRNSCSGLPVIESLPSERAFSQDGSTRCPIAEPMINFMVKTIEEHRGAKPLIESIVSRYASSTLALHPIVG